MLADTVYTHTYRPRLVPEAGTVSYKSTSGPRPLRGSFNERMMMMILMLMEPGGRDARLSSAVQ